MKDYIQWRFIVSRECMFLGSLSRHNKDLARRTLKPSARHSSRVLDKPCYSSQANQCYSSVLFKRQQENPSSKREGMSTQRFEGKRVEERVEEGERGRERERAHTCGRGRERESASFGSSFYVFPSPWACRMQIGLSQERCLFYLKSSLWSSDLPLTFLVFLATTILDSFSLFYLPNNSEFHVM